MTNVDQAIEAYLTKAKLEFESLDQLVQTRALGTVCFAIVALRRGASDRQFISAVFERVIEDWPREDLSPNKGTIDAKLKETLGLTEIGSLHELVTLLQSKEPHGRAAFELGKGSSTLVMQKRPGWAALFDAAHQACESLVGHQDGELDEAVHRMVLSGRTIVTALCLAEGRAETDKERRKFHGHALADIVGKLM
jgi:hypothetical protein